MARIWTAAAEIRRSQPDLIIGYHLPWNGLAALLLARFCRSRAFYFSVGGPAEFIGGGCYSEHALFSRIGRESPALEKRFVRLIRGTHSHTPLIRMLPVIQEDVAQRIADLSRRRGHHGVKSPVQDGASPPEDAVHGQRDSCANALHPGCERLFPRRLDDQVDVIALDGVVDHPEPTSLAATRERLAERAKPTAASQGRNVAAHAERHMDRMAARNALTLAMHHATSGRTLPTRLRLIALPANRSGRAMSETLLDRELPGGRHRLTSIGAMVQRGKTSDVD